MPTQVAARFHSPHLWIQEGMERFLQCVSVENRSGRKAALAFLDEYREPLVRAEEAATPKAGPASKAGDGSRQRRTTLCSTPMTSSICVARAALSCGCCAIWWARPPCSRRWGSIIPALTRTPAICNVYYRRPQSATWSGSSMTGSTATAGLPDFHVASVYTRPLLAKPSMELSGHSDHRESRPMPELRFP